MKNLDSSSCLVCQDDTRGLRWSLHRPVSWFVVATRVLSQSKQNAGCTKHIFGVGQGAPQGVSTAARVGQALDALDRAGAVGRDRVEERTGLGGIIAMQ